MITAPQFFRTLEGATTDMTDYGLDFLALAETMKQMSDAECIKAHRTMQGVLKRTPEQFAAIADDVETILGMLRAQVYARSPMHLAANEPIAPELRFLAQVGIYFSDRKLFNIDTSLDALKRAAAPLSINTINALRTMVNTNPLTSVIATQQEMDAVFDEVLATKE